jgi:uncharacterized oxidoreductase
MKISGNTVLITGGATGIGFHLAEEFVRRGNEVIICGRRQDKLAEAQSKLPSLSTRVCDVADPLDREALYNWVAANYGHINILVNNAGIQRMIDLRKGLRELDSGENEIEVNLTAAVYLSASFIPAFLERTEAAIVNISSGLGFVPIAVMPVYCATKAAIHSFSLSLRRQLKDTPVRVFEIIPPTVDTELDRGARARRGQAHRGIPPSEVAAAALTALEENRYESAIGQAAGLVEESKTGFEAAFNRLNSWT